MKYISHDFDAHQDVKIVKLRRVYGLEGYGLYWLLVELMGEAGGKIDVSDEALDVLSYEYRINLDIREYLGYATGIGLFELDSDAHELTSASLIRRLTKARTMSEHRREASMKRWNNYTPAEKSSKVNDPMDIRDDVDAEWAELIGIYTTSIGELTASTSDDLNAYYKSMGADVVKKAVEIAVKVERPKRRTYCNRVLSNWLTRGVKCVEDAEKIAASFKPRQTEQQTEDSTAQDWESKRHGWIV